MKKKISSEIKAIKPAPDIAALEKKIKDLETLVEAKELIITNLKSRLDIYANADRNNERIIDSLRSQLRIHESYLKILTYRG